MKMCWNLDSQKWRIKHSELHDIQFLATSNRHIDIVYVSYTFFFTGFMNTQFSMISCLTALFDAHEWKPYRKRPISFERSTGISVKISPGSFVKGRRPLQQEFKFEHPPPFIHQNSRTESHRHTPNQSFLSS